MKLQKALAVLGAGVMLFAASDAATYAATGSSLVLGRLNQANAVTTIQNTGTGNALRLITSSAAAAPLAVNGKGKVVNLYSDRAATADNAAKLGGRTITQVRAGIDASTVGGKTVPQIVSSVPRPSGVVWVAKSGGQFTSVSAALASITDSSAAHPYLIQVGPGTFNEPTGIDMKNYVDIQGSGEDVTTITCACGSASSPAIDGSSATIRALGPGLHAHIRQLTVANTGSNTFATGMWMSGGAVTDLLVDHVTATATGSVGVYAFFTLTGADTMRDVTAIATGIVGSGEVMGVVNSQSSPSDIIGVRVVAAAADTTANATVVGMLNTIASPNIRLADISAATGGYGYAYAVENVDASPTIDGATLTSGAIGQPWYLQVAGMYDDGTSSATLSNAVVHTSITNNGLFAPIYETPTHTGTTIVRSSTLNHGSFADGGSLIVENSTAIPIYGAGAACFNVLSAVPPVGLLDAHCQYIL